MDPEMEGQELKQQIPDETSKHENEIVDDAQLMETSTKEKGTVDSPGVSVDQPGDAMEAEGEAEIDTSADTVHNTITDQIIPRESPNGESVDHIGEQTKAEEEAEIDAYADTVHNTSTDQIPRESPNGESVDHIGEQTKAEEETEIDACAETVHSTVTDQIPRESSNGESVDQIGDQTKAEEEAEIDAYTETLHNTSTDQIPRDSPHGESVDHIGDQTKAEEEAEIDAYAETIYNTDADKISKESPPDVPILYTREDREAFMCKADDMADLEMKAAASALLHGAMFPYLEQFPVVLISQEEQGEQKRDNRIVAFDYVNMTVRIGHTLYASSNIRFAVLNTFETTNSVFEVMVSCRVEDQNLSQSKLYHITCPGNAKALIGCLNGFRRLLYTTYDKPTPSEYKELLSGSLPLFIGSIDRVTVENLEQNYVEFTEKTMYICLDRECLMILPSQFCETPLHQLYFWQETAPDSVELVMLVHDAMKLRMKSQKVKIEMGKYDEGKTAVFLERVRCLRPEPRQYYKDRRWRLNLCPSSSVGPVRSPAEGGIGARAWADKPRPSARITVGQEHTESTFAYQDVPDDTNRARLRSFRDEMRNAVLNFQDQDEIALPWVIAEDEIKMMLDENNVPETDILSGGLDPNNLDHFMTCVREIEQQLCQQNYDRALSILQGTKTIFRKSDQLEMAYLLQDPDIVLLKQMYFHSFA